MTIKVQSSLNGLTSVSFPYFDDNEMQQIIKYEWKNGSYQKEGFIDEYYYVSECWNDKSSVAVPKD